MVEKVTAVHENARESKCRLQQYKARIVQSMMEESRELMRQALEEVTQPFSSPPTKSASHFTEFVIFCISPFRHLDEAAAYRSLSLDAFQAKALALYCIFC